MIENGFRLGVWTGIAMELGRGFHIDCGWIWIGIFIRIAGIRMSVKLLFGLELDCIVYSLGWRWELGCAAPQKTLNIGEIRYKPYDMLCYAM